MVVRRDGHRFPPEQHPNYPYEPMVLGGPSSGLLVRALHRPLAYMLEVGSVTVEVDGAPNRVRSGETLFPLAPGRYEVAVSCRYLRPHMGRNSLSVDLQPGQMSVVAWHAPATMFQKGRIELVAKQQLPR